LLDAAFHREVLKCFTVTRQKATTVAQTVAETSAPDLTRWRFSKPPPTRVALMNLCLRDRRERSSPHDEFAKTRGGRRAIQKLLNGRKLSARDLASMGKIRGTRRISRFIDLRKCKSVIHAVGPARASQHLSICRLNRLVLNRTIDAFIRKGQRRILRNGFR
jgi:hypothetical protein